MNDCHVIRREIESAFDEGLEPGAAVRDHLVLCSACAQFDHSLRALDGALRHAEPLQPDPILVHRIQAAINRQPRSRPRIWFHPAWAAAAVLFLLVAGGAVVDWTPETPQMTFQSWLPDEPLLPDPVFLKEELVGIPGAVAMDLNTFARAVEANWAALRLWQATASGGHNPLVWAIFFVCVVVAFALDGSEWMARRIDRPGHG